MQSGHTRRQLTPGPHGSALVWRICLCTLSEAGDSAGTTGSLRLPRYGPMTVDLFYTCDFIYSHGMPRHANHLMCVCSYCACTTTTAGSFSHIDSHELAPVNTPEEAWNAHRNADAKHVELMSHVGVWGMGDVVKPLGARCQLLPCVARLQDTRPSSSSSSRRRDLLPGEETPGSSVSAVGCVASV